MRKSPVWPKFDEVGDYGAVEFDPEANFFQFLNEAKQHNKKTNLVAAPAYTEDVENPTSSKDKKGKKSLKATLFSWMRSDKKKTKPQVEPDNVAAHKTKKKKGHVSGPIHGSMHEVFTKPHRLTSGSGPLSGLFAPSRSKNEMRYLSLEELEQPYRSRSRGPIYLVT